MIDLRKLQRETTKKDSCSPSTWIGASSVFENERPKNCPVWSSSELSMRD